MLFQRVWAGYKVTHAWYNYQFRWVILCHWFVHREQRRRWNTMIVNHKINQSWCTLLRSWIACKYKGVLKSMGVLSRSSELFKVNRINSIEGYTYVQYEILKLLSPLRKYHIHNHIDFNCITYFDKTGLVLIC